MWLQVTQGRHKARGTTAVLLVENETDTFVLSGVASKPTPSLLRNFSAPVKMTVEGQTDEDLVFILANDSDAFNRCAPVTTALLWLDLLWLDLLTDSFCCSDLVFFRWTFATVQRNSERKLDALTQKR